MGNRTELSAVLFVIWAGTNLDAEIETLTGPDYENWDPAIETPLKIVNDRFIFNVAMQDDLGNNVTLPVEKAWLVITQTVSGHFTMAINVIYVGDRRLTLEINTLPLATQFLAQLPDNPAWEVSLPPTAVTV